MPQFKRFVAYLYYYENDTKEYLAGFARVEMRGDICRLEIHLKGTEYAGQEGKVSLFIRREGKILAFPVGNMRLMSQSSDYSAILPWSLPTACETSFLIIPLFPPSRHG